MRLTNSEISEIKNVITTFDPNASVVLFGSRADDTKKGGDIDLLILSEILNPQDKRNIKIALKDKLGDQKIDVVLSIKGEEPIAKIALQEGVFL